MKPPQLKGMHNEILKSNTGQKCKKVKNLNRKI